MSGGLSGLIAASLATESLVSVVRNATDWSVIPIKNLHLGDNLEWTHSLHSSVPSRMKEGMWQVSGLCQRCVGSERQMLSARIEIQLEARKYTT